MQTQTARDCAHVNRFLCSIIFESFAPSACQLSMHQVVSRRVARGFKRGYPFMRVLIQGSVFFVCAVVESISNGFLFDADAMI